jgi:hypothetical protein
MKCQKCGKAVGNAGALANHTGSDVCEVRALRAELLASGMRPAGSRWQEAKRTGGAMYATQLQPGFKGKKQRVTSQWWLPA